MDAGKSTISGVFNGSRLLEIPFYQRAYVWGEEQWERFLGDMEFVTASKRPYFLGSIILKQASSGNTWSEVSEVRTVIDGQQLKAQRLARHGLANAGHQVGQVLHLVVDGHHDGNVGDGWGGGVHELHEMRRDNARIVPCATAGSSCLSSP